MSCAIQKDGPSKKEVASGLRKYLLPSLKQLTMEKISLAIREPNYSSTVEMAELGNVIAMGTILFHPEVSIILILKSHRIKLEVILL
jgi:hypothetical protein